MPVFCSAQPHGPLWGRLLDFERDGVLDWRLLEDAVDAKIGEQLALVEWWDEHVRNGRPETNRDRTLVSRSDAEDRSGFGQQQLSRWRKALADADKYREQQILATMRKADLAPRGQGKAGAAAW